LKGNIRGFIGIFQKVMGVLKNFAFMEDIQIFSGAIPSPSLTSLQ